ncbi:MAG: NADP-reducing hydrogenase subunit HndC [Pelotomaculum sp. PtaU1.Bin065]|nr:MAG: NADP-reducing hydrogenase subunit HndC [Pelotomaculum sp. PtaU1.Bin065]
MEKIKIWINNRLAEVKKGTNILEAARSAGIEIPSLCYLKDISAPGVCRVCLVEVEKNQKKTLQASCVSLVEEGMKVFTDTPRVRHARRRMVELLLSEHKRECTSCVRNLNCELQRLADRMRVRKIHLQGERLEHLVHDKNPFIVRDYNKCVKCRRCEAVCKNVQGVGALAAQHRGFRTVIGPAFMKDLSEAACIACGQCVMACPTGALTEKESIDEVFLALADPEKFVVVQTAPSIRVTLGEAFGMPVGTVVTGKLAAALRRLGFDRVFSTDFGADITIMEESHELLERLKKRERLPLISSCSPGWVRFCEHFYPEFLNNLSSCKSPQEMMGALIKTYFAQREGIDPGKIVVVAVMPCTAKKFEAARKEMVTRGLRDVDYVVTTRELARMIRQAGLNFSELPDENYDQPLGISSGAGNIFGGTGGLTEAAVRTAFAVANPGAREPIIELKELRGVRGIKEASIDLKKGGKIKVAVVHGTRNARRVLERMKRGEHFDFVEIMACPGGCVGGGGQPIFGTPEHRELSAEYRRKRAEALYKIDLAEKLRKSHENPAVKVIYEDFLGHPLSKKAKELLHTSHAAEGRMPDLKAPASRLVGDKKQPARLIYNVPFSSKRRKSV